MALIWTYTLVGVAVVSLISLVGALTLAVREDILKKLLFYLVSFSAGALLGDVFLHIMPEIAERGYTYREGVYVLAGVFLFFMLERALHWHHSHSEHSEEVHSVVYLTQAGDTLHNFIDGIIIAASFLVSVPVGIASTVAVVFHEIPQEIGNFAVLVHGGWSTKKALFYNFLSALAAVAGALVVLLFTKGAAEVPVWLVCIAASSFVYIAMSDLIPEVHKSATEKRSALLSLWFALGIIAMGLLLLIE